MCGIAGYTHLAKHRRADVLSAALDSIAHRGPDHQGRFVAPRISMGAVRLRILDLESGDQPLFSPDRDVVIVFNGEIFNFRCIRAELEAEGFRFETNCDTEVVLHAFRKWGTECFSRFRGMFAVAIWVQSEERLILARDRVGIKPLYYCERDGDVYFGSELKCILAHPAVRRVLSLEGLNCFLSLNYVPGPFTLVDDIRKLMPGHLLEWSSGQCKVRSYLPATATPQAPSSIEEACEQLDHLLTESIAEQLVADVPIGLWLSGGLDSSTILHYAARSHASQLRTFSVTFRGYSFDESKYAQKVSRHFGTRHTEFNVDASPDLADTIENIAYYSDEPSADAGAVPLWFLAKATSDDVTVVLTGEGSDELFAGYLTYRADRYHAALRRLPTALRKSALACANRLPVSNEKISFEYKLKRLLRGSLLPPDLAHVFWNGTFSETEKRRFFLFADGGPLNSIFNQLDGSAGLERFLALDQRYYLPDDILYKVDRISMAHSLEVRPPFLDSRLVDFAASLPPSFKLRSSVSKYVLRRLMKDKLPSEILRRPKVGFDIPIHEWFRGPLRNLLLDTLSEDAIASTRLFRCAAVQHLVRDHLDKRANVGYHLWGLMTLLIWMRRWNIELAQEEHGPPGRPFSVIDEVGLLQRQLA